MQSSSQPSLLARSVENLSTVLGVWHPAYRHRMFHAGVGDALFPALLLLLVQVLDYRVLQPHAALNIQVVQSLAGGSALALVAASLVLVLLRQSPQVWPLGVGLLWALVLGTLASTAALGLSEATSLGDWMLRRFGVVFVFALVFLVCRLGWRGLVAFAGATLPTAFVALPWVVTISAPAPEEDVVFFDPDVESIYATQSALLEEQTVRLRPGVADKTEVFAVLGAGYPYEGVFRREVEAIGAILEDQFKAQDRVISLVNDDADQTTFPLMNRVNLRAALGAVSRKMNGDDVVLLYLTSHGSPGTLSINFDPLITRDLAPSDIDKALRDAGIRNAIVILPACYSGSFVQVLDGENRLILTGTDSESVSFGCNDQNEWTQWGRAFFNDALSQTRDFRQAALLAREAVKQREKDEGLPQSSPQIIEGSAIGRILDALVLDLN